MSNLELTKPLELTKLTKPVELGAPTEPADACIGVVENLTRAMSLRGEEGKVPPEEKEEFYDAVGKCVRGLGFGSLKDVIEYGEYIVKSGEATHGFRKYYESERKDEGSECVSMLQARNRLDQVVCQLLDKFGRANPDEEEGKRMKEIDEKVGELGERWEVA